MLLQEQGPFGLIFQFIILIVATESITEIVIESQLFASLRSSVRQKRFIGKLLSCGSCLSFWVAATLVIGILVFPSYTIVIAMIFAIKRIANWLASITKVQRQEDQAQLYHNSTEGKIFVKQMVHVITYEEEGRTKISHIWANKVDAESELAKLVPNNPTSKRQNIPLLVYEQNCSTCNGV